MDKKIIISLIPIILLIAIIPLTSQVFAQGSTEEFNIESILTPTTDALTEFWTALIHWAGKLITVAILLIVGVIAGKITGGIVERASRKILEKQLLVIKKKLLFQVLNQKSLQN